MSAIATVAAAISEALRGVEGVRHYPEPLGSVEPMATVLGAPELTWTTGDVEPDEALWPIALVGQVDDRTAGRLWAALPKVVEALDGIPNVVTRRARPDTFSAGGSSLPAYLIEIEVAL